MAPPAPAQEFIRGGEILHQVPGGKTAHLLQGLAAIYHPGAAGDHGIGLVVAQLQGLIKDPVAVIKRIAFGQEEGLLALHVSHSLQV